MHSWGGLKVSAGNVGLASVKGSDCRGGGQSGWRQRIVQEGKIAGSQRRGRVCQAPRDVDCLFERADGIWEKTTAEGVGVPGSRGSQTFCWKS